MRDTVGIVLYNAVREGVISSEESNKYYDHIVDTAVFADCMEVIKEGKWYTFYLSGVEYGATDYISALELSRTLLERMEQ